MEPDTFIHLPGHCVHCAEDIVLTYIGRGPDYLHYQAVCTHHGKAEIKRVPVNGVGPVQCFE